MPLAWAQSPVGDDRWHRNQGLIRWKECAEITARAGQGWWVRREGAGSADAGRSRAWHSGPDSGGWFEKSLPQEDDGDIMTPPNIRWKGAPLFQGWLRGQNEDTRAEVS